jgi:iron complex outermembrane receptor protein
MQHCRAPRRNRLTIARARHYCVPGVIQPALRTIEKYFRKRMEESVHPPVHLPEAGHAGPRGVTGRSIRRGRSCLGLLLWLLWLLAAVAPSLASGETAAIAFDIPSQRADRALTAFAKQAGVTLVFPFDLVSRTKANALVGRFGVAEGLDLLLQGTGLRGVAGGPSQIAIERVDNTGETSQVNSRKQGGLIGVLIAMLGGNAVGQGAVAPGAAAEAAGITLEEVTVTARKREESLVDIPVAVSAFSAERIQSIGTPDLEALSRFSPGLSVVNQGAGVGGRLLSGIRFRGMNPTVFTPSTQIGALFVDGVFFLGGAQSVGFEDVERVEVIRGPQAAYFGRSTFGGAINYITRDPAKEFGGQVSADYSPSYGNTAISLAIEGPLFGDSVTARLSASSREKGAQYTASDGGELGREKTETVNGTLVFEPNEALRVKLRASYSQDDDSAPLATMVSYSRVGNCRAGTPRSYLNAAGATVNGALTQSFHCGALPFAASSIDGNTTFPATFAPALYVPGAGRPAQNLPLDVRATLVDNAFGSPSLAAAPRLSNFGLVRRIERYAALLDYQLSPAFTLSAALAYNEQNGNAIRDGDFSATQAVYIGVPQRFEDKSGELRVSYDAGGRLRAMLGVNYYEQDTNATFANGVEATFGFRIPATGPLTRPNPLQNPSAADQVETTGAFGSVDFDLLEQLTVTLEGRYQVDKVGRFSGSELIGLTAEPTFESKEFLPRAILSWRPLEDTTVYAQYARGTLPGDNTNLAVFRTLTPAQRAEVQANLGGGIGEQIESEILDSYEIGLKQALLDSRLRYSLTAYYMKWENQKASASIFLTADNGRTVAFRVPGDSEIRGIEFEADWAATDSLALGATFNWTDSEYTDFKLAANAPFFGGTALAGFNAKGNTQPRFPELSGTLSATWSGAVTPDWSWSLRGDVVHTGKQFVDELNLAWIDAFTTANLRLGFRREDSFAVQAYVNNLFDQDGWATGAGAVDLSLAQFVTLPLQRGVTATPIDRRAVGIRVSYDF